MRGEEKGREGQDTGKNKIQDMTEKWKRTCLTMHFFSKTSIRCKLLDRPCRGLLVFSLIDECLVWLTVNADAVAVAMTKVMLGGNAY